MVDLLWQEKIVPRQWKDNVIVNNFIFKEKDRGDPGNYRGNTVIVRKSVL